MQIRTRTTTSAVWILGNVDQSSSPLDSYTDIRFSLSWKMSDNSVWLAFHNTGYGEEFFSPIEPIPTCSADGGVWTLFKLKRKMVLRCGDEDVYEILYKDLYDINILQRSVKSLSKTVTNIWFDLTNNAEFKRAGNILFSFNLQPLNYSLHYAYYIILYNNTIMQ